MISTHEGKASDDQILQTRLLAKESVVIGPSINKMAAKVSNLLFACSAVRLKMSHGLNGVIGCVV